MVWLACTFVKVIAADRTHRGAVHQHVRDVVARRDGDGERLVRPAEHRDVPRRGDQAACARRRRNRVADAGVSERRVDRVRRSHVGKGVAGHRADRHAIHQHIRDGMAAIGRDGEALVAAVRHGLRRGRADAAAGPCGRGDDERLQREGGADGMVGLSRS